MTIEKTMTIADVLNMDRGCAPIFMQYGMHCLGCPGATAESIEMACAVHGTSADGLTEALNEYFKDK